MFAFLVPCLTFEKDGSHFLMMRKLIQDSIQYEAKKIGFENRSEGHGL